MYVYLSFFLVELIFLSFYYYFMFFCCCIPCLFLHFTPNTHTVHTHSYTLHSHSLASSSPLSSIVTFPTILPFLSLPIRYTHTHASFPQHSTTITQRRINWRRSHQEYIYLWGKWRSFGWLVRGKEGYLSPSAFTSSYFLPHFYFCCPYIFFLFGLMVGYDNFFYHGYRDKKSYGNSSNSNSSNNSSSYSSSRTKI